MPRRLILALMELLKIVGFQIANVANPVTSVRLNYIISIGRLNRRKMNQLKEHHELHQLSE
jgi:hypothetical protein